MSDLTGPEREQRIRERAHALWEAEGRPAGRHDQHWTDAEQEIDAASAGEKTVVTEPQPRTRKARASKPDVAAKPAAVSSDPAPAPKATRGRKTAPKSA